MDSEKSNLIARVLAGEFFKMTRQAGLDFAGTMVTLETTIAKICATITFNENPRDPIRFATGMAEEMSTEVHRRVIEFFKKKGEA